MGHYTNKPQQHPDELREFLAFLQDKKIKSFLEIGSKFGGVLWAVSRIMPKRSKIVSVDLPNSHWGRGDAQPVLEECIRHLRREGFDADLILDDSTKWNVIERVVKLGPYDAIFIDANHTEDFVRKDFRNYGPLARFVCFHDISWDNPTPPGRMSTDVPKVWNEIKETYRDMASFTEIKCDPLKTQNGIGIMEWH